QEGRAANNFFSAVGGGQAPNGNVGLTYSFPGDNLTARGALRQATAVTRQSELQGRDLARNISATVVVAVESVRSAILRVKKARESVESFRAALAGEREKY